MRNLCVLMFSFFGLFLCVACNETEESVRKNIEALKQERSNLTSEVATLRENRDGAASELSSVSTQVQNLRQECSVLEHIKAGKPVRYILSLQLRQRHFTLSIKQHIADEMNKVYFEIPVDKDFYDRLGVGNSLVNEFRIGSMFLKGSFGSWDVTVVNKRVVLD